MDQDYINHVGENINILFYELEKLTKLVERIGQLIGVCPKCKNHIMISDDSIWQP